MTTKNTRATPVNGVLSPGGESAWRYIQRSYILQRRLDRLVVVSPSPKIREEVVFRLRQLAPEVRVLRPTQQILHQIDELAKTYRDDPSSGLPVAWIDLDIPRERDEPEAPSDWSAALGLLNSAREVLDRGGPVIVILGGAPSLADMLPHYPDLWSVIRTIQQLGDHMNPLQSATGDRPFCWLHLSDLHIKETADWQLDRVLKQFLDNLPALTKDVEINAVFVTGDLAFSGQKAEYEQIGVFLKKVCEVVQVDPRQRLFTTPGNHDVDRKKIHRLAESDRRVLFAKESPDEFQKFLGEIIEDPYSIDLYGQRIAAYCDFTERVLGPARAVTTEKPWRIDELAHEGIQVGIASLNSAWMCGPDDDKLGRPVLGARQLSELTTQLTRSHLRFGLLHHPISYLHPSDSSVIRDRVHKDFHAVLHGHVHNAANHQLFDGSSHHLMCGADALWAGTTWKRGFQVGSIAISTGTVEITHYKYSDQRGGFWCLDQEATTTGAVARYSLGGVAAPTRERAGAPQARLRERLCESAVKVYSRIQFIGINVFSDRQSAALRDLYVSPSLVRKGKRQRLGELEADWRSAGARVVVLGHPGSGKTTLAKYLSLRAAEEGLVPLLVPLRAYVRAEKRQSWLAYLATEMSARLSVRVGEAELVTLCAQGEAMLIVDGMDEVSNPEERGEIGDQIASFAQTYPKTSVVATSRIIGYGAGELDHKIFAHFTLVPFNEAELQAFVGQWMRMVEPSDPTARREGQMKLLAALEAEPQAKAMARNPLLATLIALVHRQRASLPGERASLYDRVVELLVRTRLAAKELRFDRIDEGIQRKLLEELALRMQEERSEEKKAVTISRRDLVDALCQLVKAHEIAHEKQVAEAWVAWLEARTGILVEQSPGVFAFLHLSLMEYLAGQALDARLRAQGGDRAVARWIATKWVEGRWRETILLLAGARATDKPLVDAIFEELSRKKWAHVDLLFALMREEVNFSSIQREQIFAAGAALSLDHPNPRFIRSSLLDTMKFGKRHGRPALEWFDQQLQSATGEALAGAAHLDPRDPPGKVEGRADLQDVLPVLWCIPRWSNWAIGASTPKTSRRWSVDMPLEVTFFLGLSAATSHAIHGHSLVSQLLRQSHWISTVNKSTTIERYAARNASRATAMHAARYIGYAIDTIASDNAVSAVHTLIFNTYYSRYNATRATRATRDIAIYVAGMNAIDSCNFEAGIINTAHLFFAISIAKDTAKNAARDFFTSTELPCSPTKPTNTTSQPPLYQTGFFESTSNTVKLSPGGKQYFQDIGRDVARAFRALTSDLNAPLDASDDKILGSLDIHSKNRFTLIFFQPIVDELTKNPTHPASQTAYLLGLGLTQYTTTRQWPWGDWWTQAFAAPHPPRFPTNTTPQPDWLVDYLWHLCWHAGEPNNPAHRSNATAALNRGDHLATTDPDPNNLTHGAFPELIAALRTYNPLNYS